jgi:hypothetical protein
VRDDILTVHGGERIAIATRETVLGDDLAHLETEVLEVFRQNTAEEQSARAGSARLQLAAMRRIISYLRPDLMTENHGQRDGHSLAEWVRRQRARRERWRREGERPLGHNLALIGCSAGWW